MVEDEMIVIEQYTESKRETRTKKQKSKSKLFSNLSILPYSLKNPI